MSKVGKGELFVYILLPIFVVTSVSKYGCMTPSPLLTPTPLISVTFSLEN